MHAERLNYIDISGIRKMFELAKAGDVVNLALGEPDFPIPEEAKKEIIKSLDEDFTHYTSNKGIDELREKIARKMLKENKVKADKEEIIITSGGSEGLHLAVLAFAEKNSEVLIPNPGFVSYEPLVRLAEAKPVYYSCKEENDFVPSVDEIENLITDKTRVIIINSPNNPKGAVYPREFFKNLAEIIQDKDIVVVSDEVYEKIIYDTKHYSMARFYENTITVNSFSKTYAMTGLRIGYVHAKEDLIEQMLKIHQYIQACASSLAQRAALKALDNEKYVADMVAELKRRRNLMYDMLIDMGIDVMKPKGAFYMFPKFGGDDKKLVMEILKKAGVVLTPGSAFGSLGKGYIRLSYATSREKIIEGMRRLKNFLKERK